ncbi:MAG: hypothetical protein WA004_03380 [Saprospiraceae bacterium]
MKTKCCLIFACIGVLTFTYCKKENDDNNDCYTEPALSDFDFAGGSAEMYQFFINNPVQYYAETGFLGLLWQYRVMQESGGVDPNLAFARMLEFFDEAAAQQAINTNQWSPQFINKMQEVLPEPMPSQWLHAILHFTGQLEQMLENNPQDPAIGQMYMMLGDGIMHAIHPDFFKAVSPIENPEFSPIYNELLCAPSENDPHTVPGMLLADPPCSKALDGSQDNDTHSFMDWTAIKTPFKTSSNGLCSTLATGLCLAKLGLGNEQVNPWQWKELSKALKSGPQGGAAMEDIAEYYKERGVDVTLAAQDQYSIITGTTRTIIEQAADALARGCDVKLVYASNDKKNGHIEFVEHIDVDPDNSIKGKVRTRSWGQAATVIFADGRFSEKSDGQSYGGGKEPFLADNGNAFFMIFCRD